MSESFCLIGCCVSKSSMDIEDFPGLAPMLHQKTQKHRLPDTKIFSQEQISLTYYSEKI
jgi:hypothetical protein